MENTKHLVNFGLCGDNSLSYNLCYAYRVKRGVPLLFNSSVSLPFGWNILDDFKIKTGAQLVVLNQPNLKGGLSLNAIYRRYENPLAHLQNFGGEMKGTLGFYKSRWFAAGEVGLDKAIVTHFSHTDSYKENVYQHVRDGCMRLQQGEISTNRSIVCKV